MRKKIIIFSVLLLSILLVACGGKTYKVTFKQNNNQDDIVLNEVKENSKIEAPKDLPSKEGFEFIGWFKEDSLKTEWKFEEDLVKSDIILYAKYRKLDISIKLNPGLDTVELGSNWIDMGATLTIDNVDQELKTTTTLDLTTLGTHEVVYSKTIGEMEYKLSRFIQVVDTTSPVLTLVEGVDTVVVGHPWIDAGVMITDNSGETIVPSIKGEVNYKVAGQYVIEYEAVDSSGNKATTQRIVNVVNN